MQENKTETADEPVLDQRLIDAVKSIIDQGSCSVSKPIRAGFTTSCIPACKDRNERLLILTPTSRILKDTVLKASPDHTRIPGNIECPLIQETVKNNPILGELPLFLPDCAKCNTIEKCEVRAILREKFTSQAPSILELCKA